MIKMQLIEHEFYYNFIIPLFWRKKLANIFIWLTPAINLQKEYKINQSTQDLC